MNEQTVICIGFDGKEYVTPVSELVPRTSVYGIVGKDGAVLLSRQSNGYDLPGGGLDLGESDEAGVVREVKEETGLDVTVRGQVGEQKEGYFKRTHADGICIHSSMRYYRAAVIGSALSTDGFDEAEKGYASMAEWWPVEKLDEIIVASSNDWRELVRQILTK